MMQAAYKTYDSYKDSGVPWLGKIPEGWGTQKSKFLWRELEYRSSKGEEELLSVSQYEGVVPRDGDSRSEDLTGYKSAEPDDLVINIMLAWMGGLGVSKYSGIVSPAYAVYRQTTPQNPKYLDYLYRTPIYLAEFARKSKGVVPSRWRMYTQDFGQVLTLLPSQDEQNRIVAFLDQKTAEIDAAIEKKQRLIELLKEQKSILINQAVTKGLTPNVPMKDSGIEWIGHIPVHWEVKKVKALMKNLDSRRIPLSGEERGRMKERLYDYYGASGVIDKVDDYIFDEPLIIIAEDGANLVMRNLRLTMIATGKYWVNNHAHILKPIIGDIRYFCDAMECVDYNPFISGAAQPKLTKNAIKNVFLPVPPAEEQSEIADKLAEIALHIKSNTEACAAQIEKLQEFKQTLIAHAVTGKIKV